MSRPPAAPVLHPPPIANGGGFSYDGNVNDQQGYEKVYGQDYVKHGQVKGTDFPGEPVASKRPVVRWVLGISVAVLIAALVGAYLWFRAWSPIEVTGDKIIVRDEAGGAIEIDTRPELPDTFPSDVPVHPDAELQTAAVLIESEDPEQEGSVYLWAVAAPLEDVGFWYLEQLERNGWEVPLKQAEATSVFIAATKGDRGFAMVLQGVSATRTEVSLTFSEQFAR